MTRPLPPLDRLHIELTNVCNFKCDFCPDAIMNRRRGHMDLALLKQILDEVQEYSIAKLITFHLMGEPLIYPRIFEGIDLALARGLPLHLTTNGSTFALKPEHIHQLIAKPLPKVTVSLQTPDPDTFTIRGAPPQLTPETYFDGITRYVQTHLQSESKTKVHIKFLDTTPHPFLVPHKPLSVINGQKAMQEEWMQWAERIFSSMATAPSSAWIQDQIRHYRPGHWHLLKLTPTLYFESFPLDSWGNVETGQVFPATWGYCNGASQQAGILYDGTVVPCCKDYEGLIPLGNVQEQSLGSILMGSVACHLKQSFSHLKVENPVCQRCIGADTPTKTWIRQAGSIGYFKVYRPLLQRLVAGWGEV